MQINGESLRVWLTIAKIEVEALVEPSEDASDPEYFRCFRFTTYDGDVLEVQCSASNESALGLLEVSELPPVKKKRKPRRVNWLKPQKR